jgi:type IV secretion system protein VirD4
LGDPPRAKVVTTYGSARWAALADVQAAGLLDNSGIILGQIDDEYLRDDGPHHVLAVAPTRSGKGVGLVVPTLLSWPESVVVHDIKGENWALTAGWRARGSDCFKFDPTDPDSACFNPLLEVRKGINEVRDAQNIADILIDPDGAREIRDHWQKTAHALLSGAILHVLYAETAGYWRDAVRRAHDGMGASATAPTSDTVSRTDTAFRCRRTSAIEGERQSR